MFHMEQNTKLLKPNLDNFKKIHLTCKDYMVSGEYYNLLYNEPYDLLKTDPIPENIKPYYKSATYISHTDSRKSLIDKVYQTVKIYTLNKKLKLINSLSTESKTILDIGCGTGDFLKVCKKNNWTTIGIEPDQDAKAIAQTKDLVVKETLLDLDENKYDIITLWHVLEHVIDLDNYIETLKNKLKDSGTLIIAVPNYKSYDAIHYKQYWAAYDVPRHIWHFSQNSISKLFSEHKMIIQNIKPMLFDAFYVSLLSEKYKHKKSNVLKSLIIGLRSNITAIRSREYSSLTYLLKKSI